MRDDHPPTTIYQPTDREAPVDAKDADGILIVALVLFLGWFFGPEIQWIAEFLANSAGHFK